MLIVPPWQNGAMMVMHESGFCAILELPRKQIWSYEPGDHVSSWPPRDSPQNSPLAFCGCVRVAWTLLASNCNCSAMATIC